MINRPFLLFRTREAFENALLENEIKDDSIVFIAEDHVIWTHGVMFGGEGSYLDAYATKEYVVDIIRNANTDFLENIYTKAEVNGLLRGLTTLKIKIIESLSEVTSPDSSTIYLVLAGDNTYLEYVYDSDNHRYIPIGQQSLSVDLSNYYTKDDIDTILNSVVRHALVYTPSQNDNVSISQTDAPGSNPWVAMAAGGTEQEGVVIPRRRHIVIEEQDYNALLSYEENAIYFVLEPQQTEETTSWTFGGAFPITLN